MKPEPFTEGERIYYRGDMANDAGFGVVTFADSRRFTVRIDDGREFRMVPQGIVTFKRAAEHKAERAEALSQLRAAVPRPKSTVEHHTGSRYVSGRDVATIAQLVRADIADAVRSGNLPAAKYRVTISRYSMGCSLTIQASGIPDVLNRFRIARMVREPHAPPAPVNDPAALILSEHGRSVEATLTALAAAYQAYDSDSQSDYHSTNFYLHVNVWTSAEMEALRADVAREIAAEKEAMPLGVVLPLARPCRDIDHAVRTLRETRQPVTFTMAMPATTNETPEHRSDDARGEDQTDWLSWLESSAVR